jgi:hypothetical protein
LSREVLTFVDLFAEQLEQRVNQVRTLTGVDG